MSLYVLTLGAVLRRKSAFDAALQFKMFGRGVNAGNVVVKAFSVQLN